jgi:hypothetical protein
MMIEILSAELKCIKRSAGATHNIDYWGYINIRISRHYRYLNIENNIIKGVETL